MSLTRRYLKSMSLTDEQVDSIIEEHTAVVNGLKAERDEYKSKADKVPSLEKDLATANEKLKTAGTNEYEEKYNKVKKEFDDYKKEQTEKETKSAKETAYKALLKEAGISEKRIESVLKVTDLAKLEIGENGEIKDKETHLNNVKTEWADFIVTTTTTGATTANPPANGGNTIMSKNDIYKMENGRFVLSASERQAELAKLKRSK